jgi:uncharacterized protein (UPF0548 family)
VFRLDRPGIWQAGKTSNRRQGIRKRDRTTCRLARYADDFVVMDFGTREYADAPHTTSSLRHANPQPKPRYAAAKLHAVGHDVPMPVAQMDERRVDQLRSAQLTYAEIGMTKQPDLPGGYRTIRRCAVLSSTKTFESARTDLLRWMIQSRAGIGVTASSDVSRDAVVDLRVAVGPLSMVAPCRVVYVIDEPDRCGFAYGTLPGHPESGEEAFVLTGSADTAITLTITAFSRPATTLSKLAGPIGRRFQDFMTDRYLRALD